MIFLANRSNLDTRTLLTRIHDRFQTQAPQEESPIEQVWYHPSSGDKAEVRAMITPELFLQTSYPVDEAQLQVSFEFPETHSCDFYRIQWVESERGLMVGWHQDETHADLGECHFQMEYQGETVQRTAAEFLDVHPLNVLDRRIEDTLRCSTRCRGRGATRGFPAIPLADHSAPSKSSSRRNRAKRLRRATTRRNCGRCWPRNTVLRGLPRFSPTTRSRG